MEGRYSKGLLFALTEPNDPTTRKEFDTWYRRIHIPDVTTGGVWHHAIRFVNPDAKPGEGYSLVTYETDLDPAEARKMLSEASAQRGPDRRFAPGMKATTAGTFKRIGGEFQMRAGCPVRTVSCVISNPAQGREEEFNTWYNDVHLIDVLEGGAYHTAYRFESLDVNATKGKYLAIYESDKSPAEIQQMMAPHVAKLRELGRMSDSFVSVGRFQGTRDWPKV
jgi:hypothetical protein